MRYTREGNYVVRGQATEAGGPAKISIFDGTYKSGFKVVKFQISAEGKSSSNDVSGVIATEDSTLVSADNWNWDNPQEVAWASNNMFTTGVRDPIVEFIDSSVILVEDFFVFVHNNIGDTNNVNYMVELEPVRLMDYEYSINYVQNHGQG